MNGLLACVLLVVILFRTIYTKTSSYLLVDTSSKETGINPRYLVVKKDDGKKMLIKLDNTTEYEKSPNDTLEMLGGKHIYNSTELL